MVIIFKTSKAGSCVIFIVIGEIKLQLHNILEQLKIWPVQRERSPSPASALSWTALPGPPGELVLKIWEGIKNQSPEPGIICPATRYCFGF